MNFKEQANEDEVISDHGVGFVIGRIDFLLNVFLFRVFFNLRENLAPLMSVVAVRLEGLNRFLIIGDDQWVAWLGLEVLVRRRTFLQREIRWEGYYLAE